MTACARIHSTVHSILVRIVLLWTLVMGAAFGADEKVALTVVMDDNYPPYIFRDADGALSGYLVDSWKLWESKTGVPVNVLASDWVSAQSRMKTGQADVIDTIFKTPEREKAMDFSRPYAEIPVTIYTDSKIGGIVDMATLRGFLVGVKAGDACINQLQSSGIHTQQTYASYEALVRAAINGEVRVFCLDEPPANYLLYRDHAQNDFRQAFRLYTGEFHRAVRKGDTATASLVERGFSAFTAEEKQALNEKWMGKPLLTPDLGRVLGLAALATLLAGGVLGLWIATLRKMVRQRTDDLSATIQAIPDQMFEFGVDGYYHRCHSLTPGLLTAPASELIGKTVSDVMPAEAAAIFLQALQEAAENGHSSGHQVELSVPLGRHWFELSVARKGTQAGNRFILLSRDVTERKLAEARLKLQSQQLQLISQSTQEINTELDSAVILRKLVTTALQVSDSADGVAGLVENGEIVFKEYYLNRQRVPFDYRFAPGHGIPGHVMQTLAPYLCNDARNDPHVIPEVQKALGCINCLDIPIINRQGVLLGCFEMHNKAGGFTRTDIQLLQGLASSAAIALENTAILAEQKRVEHALRESELLKASVLSSAAHAIIATDPQGLITIFNSGAETLLGFAAEELIGKETPLRFHDPLEVAAATQTLPNEPGLLRPSSDFDSFVARTRRSGKADEREWTYIRKDGTRLSVLLSITVMYDAQGQISGYLGIATDITSRNKAVAQLDLAAKVFEQGSEGIFITNAEHQIVMVNQAFTTITGYSAEEAIGQTPQLLHSAYHEQMTLENILAALEADGFWHGELWSRRKNGSLFPRRTSAFRVRDANGTTTHHIVTFSDISESKEAESAILRLVHFDQLTGLPNRTLLDDRIEHTLGRAKRNHEQFALMFLDLDRFKNVNDSLGHRVGDELLIQLARRLKLALRDEDTISRLGGDEFILLLPATGADGAAHVAAKLLETTAPAYCIDQHELSCTASIGIALYPDDGDTLEALSMRADTAMYRAKKAGRNTFRFFTHEMQTSSTRALKIEHALRHALDNDEFQLHFQAQLALDEGQIIGAEALLRLNTSELGSISPAEFIPVAEDSGLILPIGKWVLRAAARQTRSWLDAGLAPMVVSVNLSAVQFRQAELIQVIAQILSEENLPAMHLELELTESVTMDNPLAAIAVMGQLHELGVRMAIDDFGTGYSSMSYLKRFQAHKLKIDQSFVRDLTSDPDDEAIVTAIISLAHSLGMKTIAEGVESKAQLDFLRAKGCDEMQGYHLSRPLPAEEFAAFVRTYRLAAG